MRAGGADGPTCTPPGAAPGAAYTLTVLAFFAHGIEEMLGLPGWAQAHGFALPAPAFASAALALLLAAAVVFLLGRTFPLTRPVQLVVGLASAALLANVASHVGASLVTRSLQPGLFTALLLVLPSAGWLFVRLPLPPPLRWRAGLGGALAMPAVSALALWLAGGFA